VFSKEDQESGTQRLCVKVAGKCKHCPGKKPVKGQNTATSNFRAHLRDVHKSLHRKITEEEEQAKTKRAISKGKHKLQAETSQNEESAPTKQQRLHTYFSTMPVFNVNGLKDFRKAILNFVVDDMLPLSVVESHAFQHFCQCLRPDLQMPCRNTITNDILEAKRKLLKGMQDEFSSVQLRNPSVTMPFSTSFDLWSARNRSYLGMTTNWIDEKSLLFKSKTLACQRFPAPHTYDRIARVVLDVHAKYGIDSAVAHVVTDNGSNMIKCAEVGFLEEKWKELQEEGSLDDLTIEFTDVDEILQAEVEVSDELPSSHRCASHTLNLIADYDLNKFVASLPTSTARGGCENSNFKKLYRELESKTTALWNAIGRSNNACDEMDKVLGGRLVMKNDTRWNSKYDALKSIKKFGQFKINQLMTSLDIPPITSSQWKWLLDFISYMGPMAKGLDILQGDNVGAGYVIPSVRAIKTKIQNLSSNSECMSCLRDFLLKRVEERFSKWELSSHFLMAAVLYPKFKDLSWATEEEKKIIRDRLRTEAADADLHSSEEKSLNSEESDDDFFAATQKTNTEVDRYLLDPRNDLQMLHDYPALKSLFIMYNCVHNVLQRPS
jgi:hypothetical protein